MPYWAVPDYAALLEDVQAACEQGARTALQLRERMAREIKPDGSIVTEADRAVEHDIRAVLDRIAPNVPVWGEEHGYQPPTEAGLWMIDPVDGTSNFAFGQPLWGVTASFFHQGRIRLGVIVAPQLGWSLSAVEGQGAFLNGVRLPDVKPGPIQPFELVGHGNLDVPIKRSYPGKPRHIGSFVVEAAIYLQGGMRALVTNGVRLYDAGAGIVMAREIGADLRNLDGTEFDESQWTRDVKCAPFGFFPPDSEWPFAQSQ